MRYNIFLSCILFFILSIGNVLAYTYGVDQGVVAARDLVDDNMSFEAREFDAGAYDDMLDRRGIISQLTTRELFEELEVRVNRNKPQKPGPIGKYTKMRCDLCGRMIDTALIINHRWAAHRRSYPA
ncbi:hypothetical protein FA15DRAFT_709347 [Coprinopsis marcescibilis]|uniref:C2H2-type domain-containing protein n=1 Tax=Coprinopsis marcescibilis TaxID=230819 RepID=A0A5C3KGH0_COPMA|nr:hypothetical protein FA15DRAFT_709347 [Coprinopsis marcescibilis]